MNIPDNLVELGNFFDDLSMDLQVLSRMTESGHSPALLARMNLTARKAKAACSSNSVQSINRLLDEIQHSLLLLQCKQVQAHEKLITEIIDALQTAKKTVLESIPALEEHAERVAFLCEQHAVDDLSNELPAHLLKPSDNKHNIRILIVEDDPSCQALLEKALKRFGKCHLSNDGLEGLASYFNATENKEPFDLICLDIMMPGCDGRRVLTRIRECEEQRNLSLQESTKIIMTTALNDPPNIFGSFRGGCEGYLTKPIDIQKLLELVGKLFPQFDPENSSAPK